MINPPYCPEDYLYAPSFFICLACSHCIHTEDEFGFEVMKCKHPDFENKKMSKSKAGDER